MRLTRRRVAAALVLLVIGLGLGWAAAVLVGPDGGSSESTSTAALEAARRDVVDLMSYNYRRIDEDISTALSRTTGPFHDKMATAMEDNRKRFARLRQVSTATIQAAAVEKANSSVATILLFVDQVVTNRKTAGVAETDHTRVLLTLTKIDGDWLVSNLALT